MESLTPIDPRLIAALIGAGIVAVGWLVNTRRERVTDSRRRIEKMRDVQTALAAEILPYVEALQLFDLPRQLDLIIDHMRLDESYFPVVPSERNDTVFRAILPDIHVLPESVIRPLVRYYSQIFAIEAIIEDLRSDLFRGMDLEQREAMYADYISLKLQALKLGQNAVKAIDAELESNNG